MVTPALPISAHKNKSASGRIFRFTFSRIVLFLAGLAKHSSTFTGSETAANLNSANAKTVTVKAKWKSNEPTIPTGACTGTYGSQQNVNLDVNGTKDFSYTGSVTCAYLQKAGYYKLEVWGAQGENGKDYSTIGYGGYGGYSLGSIYTVSNSAVYVAVGGRNNSGSIGDGYNGGGSSSGSPHGASGGGATHISTVNCGELKNCGSYKGTYNSSLGTYDGGKILIVAGGGGGGSSGWSQVNHGGNGGGYIGGVGMQSNQSINCKAGNQSGGGSASTYGSTTNVTGGFGYGGYSIVNQSWGTGAGGGWYGGGGTYADGACGGSGYIGNSLLLSTKGITKQMYMYSGGAGGCSSSTATATKTTCTSSTGAHVANAANTGNGYARITYLGT